MMKSLAHIQSMSHGGNPTFSKLYGFYVPDGCGLMESVWYHWCDEKSVTMVKHHQWCHAGLGNQKTSDQHGHGCLCGKCADKVMV